MTNTPSVSSDSRKQFNDLVQSAAEAMKIDVRTCLECLKEMGVEPDDSDALELLRSEDVTDADGEKFFVSSGSVKIARFRKGWRILRGAQKQLLVEQAPTKDGLAQLAATLRPVSQYKDKELIEQYGEDCSSEILAELEKRSKGKKFVVFNKDGNVNVDATLTLLRQARKGSVTSTWLVDGTLKDVHPLGLFPKSKIEICPLFPEIVLIDGYSDRLKDTWKGIPMDVRIAVRVARDIGFIDINSKAHLARFMSDLRSVLNPKEWILSISPEIRKKYEELQEMNRLPILTKRPSLAKNGTADPFYVAKRGNCSY